MKDAKAREAALDVTRSFIVQAPAGSGKTELLVQRFLRLLAICEKPEQVLAITFTRKAAAEMRKRVLERLPSGGKSAAEVAHRLRIQTIDAFCTALTRQVPVLARFGAQPAIVEDASELYAEAAARVFADLKPATEKLLAHLDNDVPLARRLLADMLKGRDRWLRRTGAVPTRAELEAALAFERSRNLEKAKALYPDASEALARQLLTKEGTWRKRDALAQSLDKPENEAMRRALHALCSMPPAKYDDAQWGALDAILSLLKPAVAQLEVLFGERGQADFTAFSHGALRALGSVEDPSDLLLSLDQKISHILVDEFQDTSQSQFTLLEKLTAGWSPGDGRTLFVVGDPMQSIYRFREAEVSLFLKARAAGVGGVALEPLTLSTNRRSQEGLIAWFNDAFARVLPAAEDQASGAVPYLSASPYEAKLPGPAVSWHCFYDREAEARRVIEILKNKVGSAAILVRNRAHLDEIVPALKSAGVRWRAIDIEQLGEKQVVQDLYALTRALVHPGDRIAWLAVLRAPWCGLTLADLLALSSTDLIVDALSSLGALSADGQKRAARVRDVLAPIVKDRLRGTLRSRVEAAWLALGGPACAASATELEDAEIFLDELEKLEEAGDVDLAALEQRIERLYALPDLEADADAVEIMTIHRAKGLEFDTVIVPGLDRLPRAGPKPLMVWKGLANGQLLLAPIDQTGAGEDATYKYIRELDKEADDLEAGRLFYVAATRARQRLHLLACARATEERAAREPARRSLLAKVWWQAREHFGVAPVEALEEKPRMPIRDVLQRLPAGFALPPSPPGVLWKQAADEGEEAQLEFSWAGETARHIGTVVHRWLQRIAEDRMEGWDAARVDGLLEHFARDLQRRGVPAAEGRASAERVAAALKGTLADARGQWILRARADAQSERRLRARTPSGMRTYIVDRVFVDDDGTRWVVDFKTSRHEGGDAEAFLDLQRTRYASQMQGYAQVLPGARLGLYFPLLGGWREL